jgi:hypothetical protein
MIPFAAASIERQPGMVEKGLACGGRFDAVHAAAHQLDANPVFEIASVRLPSSATAMK